MQLLGRAVIKYDGEILISKKGAKFSGGRRVLTPVISTEVDGYSEQTKAPYIECEVFITEDSRLAEMAKLTSPGPGGLTVTFEADTGQTWVLKSSWLEELGEVVAGPDGGMKLKFYGKSASEIA